MNKRIQGAVHSGRSCARAYVSVLPRTRWAPVCLVGYLFATTAHAQPAGAIKTYGELELEEIVVTGTRIVRQDYVSASPIVTVPQSAFELYGSSSVQTSLNALPQFAPMYTETSNNRPGPAAVGGQAFMDLRGMGLGRTLVLLDGRRVVSANPWGAVDVNLIPQAIVENVEIITGGASAVYGSDAIAGVVNFKTRRYTGLETEANYEQTDRGDGKRWLLGVTGGLEFSRGYAYGHFSHTEREAVMQGDRKFSAVALGYDDEVGDFVPSGSGVIRQGKWNQTFGNRPTQQAIDNYLARVDPSYEAGTVTPSTPFGFNPDGSPFSQWPVYNFTGDRNEPLQPVHSDYYSYNYAPVNFLRTPTVRDNFFGGAGFNVTEATELYLQVLWADYTTRSELAPTPMYGVYIAADNPFIHPDFAALLASRPDPAAPFAFQKRMTDLGPRRYTSDYEVLQVTAGVGGKLGPLESWRYEAYVSWGETDNSAAAKGNVSRTAFEELSLAPDAGASICGGEGMNPFGIGSISADCAAHFTRNGHDNTTTRQLVAEASASGSVLELPAGELQLALGFQYREDKYDYEADPVFAAQRIDPVTGLEEPDIPGGGAPQPVSGRTDSREVFIEASLPLLADRSFAKSLDFVAGYRYGDHSNAGAVNAWKGEFTWQVAEPLMLRSSYQHAVRAPDFVSLYEPQVSGSMGFDWSGEPCDYDFNDESGEILGAQQDPEVAALCIAQGIPASALPTYADSDRLADVTSGGNPDLGEESADTITVGVVLRSPWSGALANLQASVDYYDIEIDDVIGYIEDLLFPCYDRQVNPNLDPDNFYCRRFERDPVTYEVTNVLNTAVNAASMATSGYDFQVDYAVDVGPGNLRLNTVAGYMERATYKAAPGVPTKEFAGKATGYGLVGNTALFSLVPRWKAVADVSYVVGALFTNLRWRYVGSLEDDWIKGFRLPSRQYFDLALGYSFNSGVLRGLSLNGGITNLADQEPVIYPSYAEANTDPSVYDVLGRRYFLRAKYKF
jgi:iron complex outermembrane receptor protein